MSSRRHLPRLSSRKEPRREERIDQEIIVDAYSAEERALSWYYHLEQRLRFPFRAKCTKSAATSPLRVGQIITVTGMAAEEHCDSDMNVLTRLDRRSIAVPLSQLAPVQVDADTDEAIADWHYWRRRGYQF
jgi:hypothetical protein